MSTKKNVSTFKMKKGQILLIEKHGDHSYLLLWQTGLPGTIGRWKNGDNKLILPVKNSNEAIVFIVTLKMMFGVCMKQHDIPKHLDYEFIFEIL